VNLRQHANTRDLVLDIPGMVQMAAAVMTLFPGDIIATGTPAGVGPVKNGDTIRITIDRHGRDERAGRAGHAGQDTGVREALHPRHHQTTVSAT
jgi:2-keto-4-pentenoate hydratase/2-oxohepta-3-ene-1,7-dioic acid hydratase in catechol pathway